MSSPLPPILLSRRLLLQVKSKYPKHFSPPKSSSKAKATETPWPLWMQIAGYSALVVSIPYTIGVVITQSRTLIDLLEGDYKEDDVHSDGSIGRTIMKGLRWYWGTDDEIPYVEYLENESKLKEGIHFDKEISLETENKTVSRRNQKRIEIDGSCDVSVVVESEGVLNNETYKGNISLTDQLLQSEMKYNPSRGILVTIEDAFEKNGNGDNDDNESNSIPEISTELRLTNEGNKNIKDIMEMATIYSMWHYFPPIQEMNAASILSKSSSSSGWTDPLQLRLDELQYKITELQQMLKDPFCTRDRDDMENEIKEMKREITTLKRERRIAKLKKVIPF